MWRSVIRQNFYLQPQDENIIHKNLDGEPLNEKLSGFNYSAILNRKMFVKDRKVKLLPSFITKV